MIAGGNGPVKGIRMAGVVIEDAPLYLHCTTVLKSPRGRCGETFPDGTTDWRRYLCRVWSSTVWECLPTSTPRRFKDGGAVKKVQMASIAPASVS
jgi:hypothetical protein